METLQVSAARLKNEAGGTLSLRESGAGESVVPGREQMTSYTHAPPIETGGP